MERFLRVHRGGAAFDIIEFRIVIDDDEGAFKLSASLVVDTEIGLKRFLQFHTFRNIDEGSTGPDRTIQSRILVILRRNKFSEILLHQFRILS